MADPIIIEGIIKIDKSQFEKIINDLKSIIGNIDISPALEKMNENLNNMLGVFQNISEKANALKESISSINVDNILQGFRNISNEQDNQVKKAGALVEYLKKASASLANALVEYLKKAGGSSANAFVEYLKKVGGSLANVLAECLKKVGGSLANALAEYLKKVGGSLKQLTPLGILFKVFENVIDQVAKELQGIVDILFSGLMPALQPIFDLTLQLVLAFKPIMDIILGIISAGLQQYLGVVIELVSNLAKYITDIKNTLIGWVDVFAVTRGITDGTKENLVSYRVAISDAAVAQDKLLQKINDGERLTAKEVESQKLLLKHLEEKSQKYGQLTERELKQKQQAQALISKSNMIAINELREQFEEGKNIEKGLEEQQKRIEELNEKKANSVGLSQNEKQEIKAIKDLQEKIAAAKANSEHNYLKILKDTGKLTKEQQQAAKKSYEQQLRNIDQVLEKEKKGLFDRIEAEKRIAKYKAEADKQSQLFDKPKPTQNTKDLSSLHKEIEKLQREHQQQMALIKESEVPDTAERRIRILVINQQYAMQEINIEIKKLEAKKKLNKEEELMLQKFRQQKTNLEQTHQQEQKALMVSNALSEIQAQADAQKKIFDDRKKLYDLQLKNSQGMDKAEIQSRYELRLQLVQDATEKEINAIVQADEKVQKAQEAYQKAILVNEANKNNKFWISINTEGLKKEMDDAIEVIKTGNEQIKAIKEDGANQEKALTKQTQKELEDLRIQGISNTIQRTLELEIQSIKEKYAKEKELYKDNKEIVERLEKEEQQAIRKAQIKAAEESMSATAKITLDGLKNMKNAIASTFEAKNKGEKELENMRKNHKEQENELLASLNRREIDEQEYHQKLAELTEQAAVEQAAKREEINQAMRESFVNLFGDMSNQFSETAAQIVEDMKGIEAGSDEMKDKMGDLAAAVSGVFASTLASSLAEGQSFMKSFVMSILSALQAVLPALLAIIFGVTEASPGNILSAGIWGKIQFALISAALMGMVELAKSAVESMEFYKGGLVNEGYRSHDSVDAKLAKGEFVVNNKAVTKGDNLRFLQKLNNSNLDINDIFRNEYLKNENQQLKFIKNLDWNNSQRLNEIITKGQLVIQLDNKPLVNEIRATNDGIKLTTDEIKDLKQVLIEKDLSVVNKIYSDNIKVRHQKIFAQYGIH